MVFGVFFFKSAASGACDVLGGQGLEGVTSEKAAAAFWLLLSKSLEHMIKIKHVQGSRKLPELPILKIRHMFKDHDESRSIYHYALAHSTKEQGGRLGKIHTSHNF